MERIRVEHHDGVATLRLDRGVTNALDMQLLEELGEALRTAERDPDVRGLVLGSTNEKFFSIGFDIPQLFDLPQGEFRRFYDAFNEVCLQLVTVPKPTVAALTGHATAGGCILALCCDYRFVADGRKLMGLNEIKLGVPVPYVVDCILRQIAGARITRDFLDGGEFYRPAALAEMGLVDAVLPLEEVLPKAIEKAGALGAMPARAFAMIKRNRVEELEARVVARLPEKASIFVECWYSAEARARLREAMEHF
jgi:enoyl-CoA hydratase/carnithine racemase